MRIAAVWLVALLCGVSLAQAQQATERYVPVGESPGLSAEQTTIGRILAADSRSGTLELAGPAGSRTVKITDRTRVWLDRTPLGLTNVKGDFADCQRGRTAEVRYRDPEEQALADWVKVRIAEDGPGEGPE